MRVRSIALAAVAAALTSGCGPDGPARPDLVLISVDTLRPDRLACYGGAADVGNAICALGDAGVRYAWAFSTASSTPPSIASLETARLPRDHGATGRLASDAVTLAETLAANGYSTGGFVANPVLSRSRGGRGFDQGFAVYDDQMQRRELNRPLLEREARELTDSALAWVRDAKPPFFLWIHYQDPHGPYDPPDAPAARDASDAQPLLPVLADQSGWNGIPAYQVLGDARAPATYEGRYADEIRYVDAQIARLVATLDARPARPAILLTADHGEAFGEDGFWFAHGHSLAIDQIHIPMFWRPAQAQPGRVVAKPVSNLDVAPTLVAAAGIPLPPSFEGVSLDARESSANTSPLYAEHRLRVAVIAGDHYYARDRTPFTEPQPEPVSGGLVPPLPPRTAALPADGRFTGYADSAATPALERLVAAFLAQPSAPATATPRVLDDQSREALRALGYLE